MPRSIARSMIEKLSCSDVSGPKFIVPRQSGLTLRPSRPRCTYSIKPSSGSETPLHHSCPGVRTVLASLAVLPPVPRSRRDRSTLRFDANRLEGAVAFGSARPRIEHERERERATEQAGRDQRRVDAERVGGGTDDCERRRHSSDRDHPVQTRNAPEKL